jgi:beta-lactamase class A
VVISYAKSNNNQATPAAQDSGLSSLVTSFASTNGSSIGVVVTDLSTGSSATAHADQQFVSASLYKLFVAYDTYRDIDDGMLSLAQSITTASSTSTIGQCLNLMITVSDNDCGVALGEIDGWSTLDDLLSSQGYTQTTLDNYSADGSVNGDKMTSAHDVALLLQRLYDGTLLSRSSTSAFIILLQDQTINDRLPMGLPDGTVIAHKTGDLYGYLHDAGIIYGTNKNMLVVLLTGEWDDPQTQGIPLFTNLASSVWSYMQN